MRRLWKRLMELVGQTPRPDGELARVQRRQRAVKQVLTAIEAEQARKVVRESRR